MPFLPPNRQRQSTEVIKLTQLDDALLVTRLSVTKFIIIIIILFAQ